MPAIENSLVALVVDTEPKAATPEKPNGGADDFEQAMTQALAPGGKKAVEKPMPTAMGRRLPPMPAAGAIPPLDLLAVENPEKKSAPPAEKKTEAPPESKLSETLNPATVFLFPLADSIPPVVSFIVPPSGDFSADKTAPVTGEKISAADPVEVFRNISADKIAPPEIFGAGRPEPGGASPSFTKSTLPASEPEKNPAVTNPATALVSPVAEAAALPEKEIALMNFVEADAATNDSPEPLAVRGNLDLNRSPVAAVAAKNSGTGVASSVPAMKNSDKVEVFAGLTGQKLPGAGPTRSAASGLPMLPEISAHGKISTEFVMPFAGGETGNNYSASSAEALTQVNVLALPSLAEARLHTVERAHDMVSLHALRLVETKADAMSVVLKPEAGTELSLELRQRGGVIEAHAVLTAGDYQFLNQHWADLQSRLELRGIKLGPLGGEENFNFGGGNFSQQQSARDEETESAAAFAEFAAMAGGASARHAPALRGWESWA